MEKQIENILIKVDEGTMPVQQALSELLRLFSVSSSVCYGCEFDKKCNMQDNGRYKEICSHFKQTDC
jgi:cellulose synthase/poly-beta-1,6-N-acetylglucosamine synthase-like glycosyltransferase